jgi:uncharacterized protein YjiS (DUF1127 family)
MTTLQHPIATTHSDTRPALIVRVANVVSSVFRAWRNRRDFYRLGEMSDSELADIGLTRTDLYLVVRPPFTIDPTVRLGAIARARILGEEEVARRIY